MKLLTCGRVRVVRSARLVSFLIFTSSCSANCGLFCFAADIGRERTNVDVVRVAYDVTNCAVDGHSWSKSDG